jgi:hypothetical protein
MGKDLLPNVLTPLQITSAAGAHLRDGQFLLEVKTLNIAQPQINWAGTGRPTIYRGVLQRSNIEPR